VGRCPSYEDFRIRAYRRFNAEILFQFRSVAKAQAEREKSHCEEARDALNEALIKDWSGLLAMQRFDHNDLPPQRLEQVRTILTRSSLAQLGPALQSSLADTLRGLLADQAFARSAHLESDQQRNSAVAIKMRDHDITDDELALLRNSAHVLALRVDDLDAIRSSRGISFQAEFSVAMWSFDPVKKDFTLEGAWRGSGNEDGNPSAAGTRLASNAASVASGILELPAFHFTTQIIGANEGSFLQPLSKLSTNTAADLVPGRRFRYLENRQDDSGRTTSTPAGYGFLQSRGDSDSAWIVRHIGGIEPYAGLVMEEVPGDGWGYFSYAQVPAELEGSTDFGTSMGDRRVVLRHAGPAWEFRLGARKSIWTPFTYFGLDLPVRFQDVHGAIVEALAPSRTSAPTSLYSARETGLLYGFGLEPGLHFRGNIRRVFLSAGIQAGVRMDWMGLSNEDRVVDRSWGEHPDSSRATPLADDDVNWLRNVEGVVSLHGGLQISLTPWSGLGLDVGWDWLLGRSGWDYGAGRDFYDADWIPVTGTVAGQQRLRWQFQYIWK
jgi:hypothetical protein